MSTTSKRKLPDPHSPEALSVTDGQQTVGSVVRQGDEFFAFNANGECLGAFDTAIEAVRRIPAERRREAAS